jgi:malonyl-CoA/methylmalonyl-CoA synthetase
MSNTLYDALFAPNRDNPEPFLHTSDGQLRYDAFVILAARTAAVLRAANLSPGDRLVAQVGKSATALALYAGAVQTGVVYLPLNTAYTPAEARYFIEDSGAKLVIADPASRDALASYAPRIETLAADGTAGTFADILASAEPDFTVTPRTPDDLAALLYTSGTTGRSKGAMLSHANLLSNAETLRDLWRFTADDTLFHALPIFHTHGLFVATNIMALVGGAMIFEPKFDLDRLFAALPQATSMMGVPTFYTRMLSDPRLTPDATRHMRLFISGSAPLLDETHRAFQSRTGHAILERYGMTETNMTASNPYEGDRRPGTVGQPLPGVSTRIVSPETGQPVTPGDIGELEVKGPNVFQGYWQMPEKTAQEFRPDGFFRTGDLARLDDGYIQIVGRNKDLIISGGYNIYPKEIETVLDALPGVTESAVIGVPHPDFGETVVAILVGAPDLDTGAILAAARDQLAGFKLPRRLVVQSELPRNAMGKVQKNVLRESHKDTYSA